MKTNRVPHRERRVLRILLQKIWWVYDSFNFIHSFISAFVRQSIHPSLFVCFFRSIVRSFTHSFCFIRSIGRSIIHSYSLIHWFIDSLTRSFVHSFFHSFIHSFVRSFIHSFAGFFCSFVRSFVCSFIIYSSISKSDEDLLSIWTNSNMRWIQVMSVSLVCSVFARFLFISITKIHGRIRTPTHSHNRVANDQ